MKKNGNVREGRASTGVKSRRGQIRRGGEDGGTMTLGDKAKADTVVKLFNEAIATEMDCVLRYKRHYFMAAGISSFSAKAEFFQCAMEEQAHADPLTELAERIVQLGGEPNLSLEGFLNRGHQVYEEGESLREVIREDLHAKRIAINSYREMVASVGTDDPMSSRLLKKILAQEQEQAADRESLLRILGS